MSSLLDWSLPWWAVTEAYLAVPVRLRRRLRWRTWQPLSGLMNGLARPRSIKCTVERA